MAAVTSQFCESCGNAVGELAKFCCSCGTGTDRAADAQREPPPPAKKGSPFGAIALWALGPLIAIATSALVFSDLGGDGPIKAVADQRLSEVKAQVAEDAVAQYEIAARTGSKIDICVQAGLVKAAYLQAQNANEYRQWNNKQRVECAKAGLPAF